MVLAKDPVEKGMADRVESLDATLGRMAKGRSTQGARAEVEEETATVLVSLEGRERRSRFWVESSERPN